MSAQDGVWTQRNGQQIHVSEMDDGHLANTIAMLERKGRIGSAAAIFAIRAVKPERAKEDIADVFERRLKPLDEWLDTLRAERRRRREDAQVR